MGKGRAQQRRSGRASRWREGLSGAGRAAAGGQGSAKHALVRGVHDAHHCRHQRLAKPKHQEGNNPERKKEGNEATGHAHAVSDHFHPAEPADVGIASHRPGLQVAQHLHLAGQRGDAAGVGGGEVQRCGAPVGARCPAVGERFLAVAARVKGKLTPSWSADGRSGETVRLRLSSRGVLSPAPPRFQVRVSSLSAAREKEAQAARSPLPSRSEPQCASSPRQTSSPLLRSLYFMRAPASPRPLLRAR